MKLLRLITGWRQTLSTASKQAGRPQGEPSVVASQPPAAANGPRTPAQAAIAVSGSDASLPAMPEAIVQADIEPALPTHSGPERRVEAPRLNARPGTRMLIIDDSPTIVALLGRMLRQNGYATIEAFDAESGIEIACREVPDLVFLDIVLPGMDGFSALRALRRDPRTKAMPIIMISGNAQATEQFYVQRIGADDFMKKPFSRAEVFARIERLLDADCVPARAATAAASRLATA